MFNKWKLSIKSWMVRQGILVVVCKLCGREFEGADYPEALERAKKHLNWCPCSPDPNWRDI